MSWIAHVHGMMTDPVRVNQVFMLCRHTGVLLASIVVARTLPAGAVGGLEKLLLCGYLLTFFWTEALLKGFLSRPALWGDPVSRGAFLWLVMVGSLLAMTVLVGLSPWLVPLLSGDAHLTGLGLFAVYQAMIIPLWIAPFLGLLRGLNPMLLAAYVLIGPAFSAWMGLRQLPEVRGVMIGWVSYAFVGLGWLLITTRPAWTQRIRRVVADIWPVAWPLMLFAISAGLARSFDAWLVAHLAGDEDFAVFRYGAREFPWVTALVAGFSTAMLPLLADGGQLDQLKQRSGRLMHLTLPLVAGVMVLSPLLFPWVFGEAYAAGAIIFNIYLLLSLTQLVFPQTVFNARGDTRLLWHVSLMELAVNVACSIPLFYLLGLPGVAAGTLIAFVSEKIILLIRLKRRYDISMRDIVPVTLWCRYALLLSLAFLLSLWIY